MKTKYEHSREWMDKNPEKRKAHIAVFYAFKKGILRRDKCFCGLSKVEAHHEDYTKPLEIQWFCKKHHVQADRRRKGLVNSFDIDGMDFPRHADIIEIPMEPRTIKPDYLMIPYVLYDTPGIQPVDRDIYGAIYWFEHMKDGVCTASNDTLASIVNAVPRSVQNSLNRLEQGGFIEREYKDVTKKNRILIKALVAFRYSHNQTMKTPEKTEKPKKVSVAAAIVDTPADHARKFFNRDKATMKEVIEAMLIGSHGKMSEEYLLKEMQEFILYWTEPTPNGKSTKWEKEKQFEIKRRLYFWISRPWKKNKSSSAPRSGAGITV